MKFASVKEYDEWVKKQEAEKKKAPAKPVGPKPKKTTEE